jgi:hypothetical protein
MQYYIRTFTSCTYTPLYLYTYIPLFLYNIILYNILKYPLRCRQNYSLRNL